MADALCRVVEVCYSGQHLSDDVACHRKKAVGRECLFLRYERVMGSEERRVEQVLQGVITERHPDREHVWSCAVRSCMYDVNDLVLLQLEPSHLERPLTFE
jgi:hypothetical protein